MLVEDSPVYSRQGLFLLFTQSITSLCRGITRPSLHDRSLSRPLDSFIPAIPVDTLYF